VAARRRAVVARPAAISLRAVMTWVMVEHPDPARSLPHTRMPYRSVPLRPARGLYLKRIVPNSVSVPLAGGIVTAAERKTLVGAAP